MQDDEILAGKRMLIVDDDPDVLETLEEIFVKCLIDKAPTFEAGKKLLEKNTYDVAIFDIMGVKGYELLRLANQNGIPAGGRGAALCRGYGAAREGARTAPVPAPGANAIDAFHDDWKTGKIPKTSDAASEDGYPKTLQILVDGAESGLAKDTKLRYLRRIPRDPFGDSARQPAEQWVLRGYQDEPDAMTWSGKDVYDLRSASDETAIDGTKYKDW